MSEENFKDGSFEESEAEEELSFTDKVTGIITSPVKTMESVSKFTPKASDWLLPIMIFIIISGLAIYLYQSNPALKAEMDRKSMEAIDKSFSDKIEKGDLTQQEADKQKEKITEQMEKAGSSTVFLQIFGIIIFVFITFFIINAIFFLLIKFVLKGEGNYSSALSAYGLTYYILILQTIITMILSLAFNKFIVGLSLMNLINADMMSFSGFLLRKADPFLIWFYAVLGIAYAKMFHSVDIKKYIILTFAVWILGNLLLYYLSTLSSFFSGFAM